MGALTRRTLLAGGAALAASGTAFARKRRRRGSRARWCGSTWTSRSSTTPTTRRWAPNAAYLSSAARPERADARSGSARRSASAYGSTPIEGLDLFATKRPNAPMNISSTAAPGAAGSPRTTAYPAELFVNAGAHFVALDFNNVIETKGDLMPMAEQVRARHRLGLQERRELRRRSEPHLRVRPFVGRAPRRRRADHRLAEGFRPAGRRHQGRAVSSGMYDLKPVRLSARSSYVKFTDEMEHALSTQRHLAQLNCPVIVHLRHARDAGIPAPVARFRGGGESGRQAGRAPGRPEYNHFEIMDTLASPYGLRAARCWSR